MSVALRETRVKFAVMVRSCSHLGDLRRLLPSLVVAGWLGLTAAPSGAQTALNVTNFGAVGDAVQFFVNTTSNSVVVTTTDQLSGADIGKAIEVFGAGAATAPPNCQDMVATITNVVNGTNIYVSQISQATLTNTFATYGTDNSSNFQAAINTCGADTNDTISIPAGQFLLLADQISRNGTFGNAGMVVTNGGIHFVGSGTNTTTLFGQGSWTLLNGRVSRGVILVLHPPMINANFSIGNLTLDGGVQQGYISDHGYPPNTVTGTGWDGTHHAIQIGGTGSLVPYMQFTNIVFQHFRGEIAESVDGSTNGNLSILNCIFSDGNATAINIYPSLNISHCVFNGLLQVAEYYQKYSTNTSYFQDNLCTNIEGNGFAINGATGTNPSFIIQSNTFYFSGANGIETTPGDNVYILGNNMFDGNPAIALGVAGYQGYFVNSNIVVAFNLFSNCFNGVEVEGAGANAVYDVSVVTNTFYGCGGASTFALGYGWSTNVSLVGNVVVTNSGFAEAVNGTSLGGQWFFDNKANIFPSHGDWGATGATNTISYARGIVHVLHGVATNMWAIDDAHPEQVPAGACLAITYNGGCPAPLRPSVSMAGTAILLTNWQTVNFQWTNGMWMNLAANGPMPPTNVRVFKIGP